MGRLSHQVIYQIGFAIGCLMCTIFSFTTLYKLDVPMSDETTRTLTAKLSTFNRGYVMLVIIAFILGIIAVFVYFNKALMIVSGVILCGVGLRFMTYADSTRGQLRLINEEEIYTDMLGTILQTLSGDANALAEKASGTFTFTFWGYMIFAVIALVCAVLGALFIDTDSYVH